ncbi:MAG: hypothetical protein QHJ73_17665, partial [Armatimonadota bacterium]|nr:hypothetical protein [Armatimonadota bacterium]
HQRDDCAKCHAQMAPASHRKAGFRDRVAEEAKGQERLCQLCHGVVLPHPPGFLLGHKGQGASLESGSPCFTCHKKQEFCSRCHKEE